jgi:hypothetical protein
MKLKELKDWVNSLPEDCAEFDIVNGDLTESENEYTYQIEKPVVAVYMDKENKEVIILTQKIQNETV